MQVEPRYDDVVAEVAGVPRGTPRGRRCGRDPGGAGLPRPRDRLRQDAGLRTSSCFRGLERICSIGRPVLVGLSRKSTLARVLGDPTRPRRQHRRVRRRRRGGVRSRRGAVPRPRRRTACRGAGPLRLSSAGRRVTIELRRVSSSTASTASSSRSVATASGSSSTSSSSSDEQRHAATGSRTPSTTAPSWPSSGRSRTSGPTTCSRRSRARSPMRCSPASRSSAASARAQARRRARSARGVRRRARRAPVTVAYVGLGANLGDREGTIRAAVARRCRTSSPSRRCARPIRSAHRPAAIPERRRRARDRAHAAGAARRPARGRAPAGPRAQGPRWGPRTIDLDLLLYGDEVIDEAGLDRSASAPARAPASCWSRSPSSRRSSSFRAAAGGGAALES